MLGQQERRWYMLATWAAITMCVLCLAQVPSCDNQRQTEAAKVANTVAFLNAMVERNQDACIADYLHARVSATQRLLAEKSALRERLPYVVTAYMGRNLAYARPWQLTIVSLAGDDRAAEVLFSNAGGTEVCQVTMPCGPEQSPLPRDSLIRMDDIIIIHGDRSELGEDAYRVEMPAVPHVIIPGHIKLEELTVRIVTSEGASNPVDIAVLCDNLRDRAFQELNRLEEAGAGEHPGLMMHLENARERLREIESYDMPIPVLCAVYDCGDGTCNAEAIWLESGFRIDGCEVVSKELSDREYRAIEWSEGESLRSRLLRVAELMNVDCAAWRDGQVRLLGDDGTLALTVPIVVVPSE